MNGPDSVLLATGGYDHTIRFWQAHTGICYKTVQHPDSQVNDLAITPDKQMIGAAGDQHVRMYSINSSNTSPVINYDGISRNVTSVGFQEDGRFMFTGGEDCSARIWDLRARSPQCQKVFQVTAPVNTVALHPNQAELFVGDQNGAIHIWDLKSDRNEQLLPEPDASIVSLAVNLEGTLLASVTNEGTCYVWSILEGDGDTDGENPSILKPKTKLTAHQRQSLKCCFSPDSKYLATTSADTSCRVWKLPDLTLVTEVKAKDKAWMWDCAFSADAKFLITASSDNFANLWDLETGEKKREYQGHTKAVTSLAFMDNYVD